MTHRALSLPGRICLVPGRNLEGTWSRQVRDHPYLPADIDQVANDLDAINGQGGVPATIDAARGVGKDPSLLIYGRTYRLRLFPSPQRDGYVIAAIDPLRLSDHHRLAKGCLRLCPELWEAEFELWRIPRGCSSYWQEILMAAAEVPGAASTPAGCGSTARQAAFLDTIDRLIDADEKITMEAAASTRPFPYRDVQPVGERRHGAHPVYEFVLVARAPEQGMFVQVRGERSQRGQVTRATARSATIRFDQPVDWEHIPRQGQLEESFIRIVYDKQRESVARLRNGQADNSTLLTVLTSYRTAPIRPAADEPAEDLDDDQLEAFRKAVSVPDMLLVLGPPGTGKTRTISQITRACALGATGQRAPSRVLVTSHTHKAVDNVLARLPRDLLAIRVGNDGKVTAEGRPYLLESLVAELRSRILNHTARALAAYENLGVAREWAIELTSRLDKLSTAIDEETQAASDLSAARRAAGGSAQEKLDAVAKRHRALDEMLTSNLGQIDRLARRCARARERMGTPVLGAIFGLVTRRRERRLAAAQEEGARLRAELEVTTAEMARAQQELDEATRSHPAVQAAVTVLNRATSRRGECRAAASTAAQTCDEIVRSMDVPPATVDGGEQALFDLRSWLIKRLPVLEARQRLLTGWQQEVVSSAADQLSPELIRYADVVAATCIGAASRPELSDLDFDLAIVDEAGQIGIANVLVPLVRARRCVLVGDHQQLPPYLDSEVEEWGMEVDDPLVRDLLAKSTLELLVGNLAAENVVMLTQQRRMPAVIADFISARFYGGRLRTAVHRDHRDPLFDSPLAFIDTSGLPAGQRCEKSGRDRERWGQPGYTNPAEADLLTELAVFYHRLGAEWAVIVPYRAQVARIMAAVTPLIGNAELASLNIGTVDSFQGGERDVILYGFTRSNPSGSVGFLSELRRVNVAFTRAKRQLVLVGDMNTLTMASNHQFRELAHSLSACLSAHGDVRQYRDLCDRVSRANTPAGER